LILADSSIWVDHIRRGDPHLSSLLGAKQIFMHPFVIGEIALGNLKDRRPFLEGLRDLPGIVHATNDEVFDLIERFGLYGRGIGFADAHLLASARLMADTLLWTRDKRLARCAAEQQLQYSPPE
jgi:predicted nucleic acid-binding protein